MKLSFIAHLPIIGRGLAIPLIEFKIPQIKQIKLNINNGIAKITINDKVIAKNGII